MIQSTKGAAARLQQLQAKLFTQQKLRLESPQSTEQAALTSQISDLGKRLIGFGKVMDGVNSATSQVRGAASRAEQVRDLIDQAKYLLVSTRENAAMGTEVVSETTTTAASTTGGGGISAGATLQSLGMTRSRDMTIDVTQNGATTRTTLTLSKSETVADAVSRINDIAGITASINRSGAIEISGDSGSSFTLSDNGTSRSSLSSLGVLKLSAGTYNPTTTSTETVVNTGPQIDRDALAAKYNAIMGQIDDLIGRDDSTNLLRGGNISIATREKGDYFSITPGEDISRSRLGLTEAQNTFASDTDIDSALTQLDSANDTVARVGARIDKDAALAELWQGFQMQMANQLHDTYQQLTEKQAMDAAASARSALTGQFQAHSLTGSTNILSSF